MAKKKLKAELEKENIELKAEISKLKDQLAKMPKGGASIKTKSSTTVFIPGVKK